MMTMNDKTYLKRIREDLIIIYNNLEVADASDIELLLFGIISDIDERMSSKPATNKKSSQKSKIDLAMIEERVYPDDYFQRAKYILARLRFHYPNYKKTRFYIKAQVSAGKTSNFKYLGIPPFEFWAINKDMKFYMQELKTNLKEFRSIFEEYFLNKLSLSKYAEKCFNDRSHKGKKRAENLLDRFYSALAKALELKDIADKSCAEVKIDNEEYKIYQLVKEMENNKPTT